MNQGGAHLVPMHDWFDVILHPCIFSLELRLLPQPVSCCSHKQMGQEFRFHRGSEKHGPTGVPLRKRNRGGGKLIR